MKEQKNGMVRIRGGFSDQNGLLQFNTIMQVNEFNDETRMLINSKLFLLLRDLEKRASEIVLPEYKELRLISRFCEEVLIDAFNFNSVLQGAVPISLHIAYSNYISKAILYASYNEVLDILQYIHLWFSPKMCLEYHDCISALLNKIFETEYVGYRFVANKIVAITDECEIESIQEASNVPFDGCRRHIEKAISFLADRETKDYKNCIKESISAVEALCRVIVKNEKATLSDAIRQLESCRIHIHPTLKAALSKLYAYTSDEGGIRHAEGITENEVTFDEAKFMLVSCCAFTNYLIAQYGKTIK